MSGLLLAAAMFAAPAAAQDFTVDDGHTSVLFAIKHFDAAWVYGRFNEVSGGFTWDKDPAKVKLDVKIATASVDTDLEKRDTHLRSADFFDAAQFPEITFTSTACKAAGDGLSCTGKLSMHGVTKDVTVPLVRTGEGADPWGGYRLGLHSELTLKRSEFGITHMADGLSDEVKLIVAIEGTKNK